MRKKQESKAPAAQGCECRHVEQPTPAEVLKPKGITERQARGLPEGVPFLGRVRGVPVRAAPRCAVDDLPCAHVLRGRQRRPN